MVLKTYNPHPYESIRISFYQVKYLEKILTFRVNYRKNIARELCKSLYYNIYGGESGKM